MRMLIAGDWHSDLHEEEVARSMIRLGHEVQRFKWHGHFAFDPSRPRSPAALFRRAQDKFVAGPAIRRINREFVECARQSRPDAVFVYRGTHLDAASIRAVKAELPQCAIVGYNNDDPFSPAQPGYYWRHFLAAIPAYDLMLAYRHANLDDFRRAGARRVELLRSWFVPDRSHPVALGPQEAEAFDTDVVFVGHYEADQRLDHLEAIVNEGFRLRLFGPTRYWAGPLAKSAALRHLAPTRMVWGADYNRALCGARVALCFFSKLNRDTYTRRCFEIPATRTLMLSEYSVDTASLYAEGVEADFFRDRAEMLAKIRHYLSEAESRQRVAAAGWRKVHDAGHDIDSRMRQVVAWIQEVRH